MMNFRKQCRNVRLLLRVLSLSITLLLLTTLTGYSQENSVKVTGTVFDETNFPVPGATVVIKGTTIGAATDIDGKFTLNIPIGQTLQISFIGYMTIDKIIIKEEDFNIYLKQDMQVIDEVIVTGFGGVQKTKTQTASAAVVRVADLQKLPLTSLASGLGGRVTGVVTQERSGMPGEVSKIWIRGGSKILYVIDDVVMETKEGEIFFNRLRPDDIEYMTILKDASATAVYGPRATDGVVVVTTKKGVMGQIDITVSQKISMMAPSYKTEIMSQYEYAQWRNEVGQANYEENPVYGSDKLSKWHMGELYQQGVSHNDMVGIVNSKHGTEYTLKEIQDLFDPNVTQNDNIQDYYTFHDPWELFDHIQPMYQTNVSVRGGSERLRYYSSIGYLKQKGIYETFDFEQINFMLNTEAFLLEDKSLRLILNLNGNTTMQKRPKAGESVFKDVMFSSNPGDAQISNYWSTDLLRLWGPESRMQTGFNNTRQYRAQGSLGLKWYIPRVDGLVVTGTANFNTSYGMTKLFEHSPVGAYWSPIATKPNTWDSNAAKVEQKWENYLLTTGNLQADYSKNINKHNLFAMVSYSSQVRHTNSSSSKSRGYPTIDTPQIGMGADMDGMGGGETKWGSAAFVGRLNYDYDSKYLFTYGANYSGSLSYSPDKRWGFFQAASVGWVLSEEDFFKNAIPTEWVSMFKLRYGFGLVGQETGDPFSFLNSYGQIQDKNDGDNTDRVLFGTGLDAQVAWNEKNVANDLTWSSSQQMTGGIDFGFFNNKLTGALDIFLYINKGEAVNMTPDAIRTDILGMPNVPKVNTPDETSRKGGYEISFRWEDQLTPDFRYHIGLNYSFWDQRITRHADENINYYIKDYNNLGLRNLHNVYNFNYQTSDKLLGSWEDIYNNQILTLPSGYQSNVPGTIQMSDVSGDGRIGSADRSHLNNPGSTPLTMYGINLGGAWKGFQLDMFFQGATNVSGTTASPIRNNNSWFWNYGKAVAQYSYTPSNPNVDAPLALANGSESMGALYLDRHAYDASYFKMKDISLRYNFMETVFKNDEFLKLLELSFTVTNVFTLTKDSFPYKGLADPEFVTTGSNMYAGDDVGHLGGYPTQRTFTLGLTVTF